MAPGRSALNKIGLCVPRSTSFLNPRPTRKGLSTCPSCSSFAHTRFLPSLAHRPIHIATGSSSSAASATTRGKAFRHPSLIKGTAWSPYSTVVVHNKGQARVRRTISFLLISTVSFAVGTYFAVTYASPLPTALIMGSMPSDVETLSLYTPDNDFAREVDDHIKNCALAQSLRANPDFVESRPHLKIPEEMRQHNLTAGTLSGPGMIAVPPYYFNEKGGKSMVQIFYVGTDVSGHPGIVHGGFLATMLDEGLARCAFPAMPNKVGVTANLNINYLKPTMAGQFLVLRATTTRVEGRKAWAEGWIESLEVAEGEEPVKLVEATALFVEPKHAKVRSS
ncbi:uncharacterized protein Z519_08165 [Cladophialophora bantiana CBS 173.52]|uniref:Thioesterase domain-containing protein n=1 Tax=Cladophialophora bantiana (strain ATCC 10958 / CBS 173.52 / CDC B-1940 / NIH 8579) TaxID=1442370 RepID=A0A0D2I2Y4_CLAB1|nr:uncharacterized protein Z519_08165 [Cladophialophora bantiana CBS 173.52]KIW91269.1 hypothetical protein Z519_08165 [Cladophialophora bantiana CBS 173.52]